MDVSTPLPMNNIRHKYLQSLSNQRDDILRLLPAETLPQAQSEQAIELKAFAHKLAGTGKIYGFPEISEAGYSLECAIRQEDITPADVGRKARYLLSVMERAIKTADVKSHVPEKKEKRRSAGSERGGTPNFEPGRPLLLVIDDDEGITDIVHSLFDQIANVVICRDVPSGLAAACELKPHLILLDEQMPGEQSGLDLLQQLRDIPITAGTPVIMMSADDSLTSIMQALVSGATDYVIKPFEPMALLTKGLDMLKTYQTRILVVDDDEAVRDVLAYKLTNAGCDVIAVGECQEAWELLEKQSFSLVLLDRMMPDLDGTILLRMMQGEDTTSRIPVVFLSAKRSAADVVDGLLTGATEYITKPFDPDDVVKRCLDLVKAKKH